MRFTCSNFQCKILDKENLCRLEKKIHFFFGERLVELSLPPPPTQLFTADLKGGKRGRDL